MPLIADSSPSDLSEGSDYDSSGQSKRKRKRTRQNVHKRRRTPRQSRRSESSQSSKSSIMSIHDTVKPVEDLDAARRPALPPSPQAVVCGVCTSAIELGHNTDSCAFPKNIGDVGGQRCMKPFHQGLAQCAKLRVQLTAAFPGFYAGTAQKRNVRVCAGCYESGTELIQSVAAEQKRVRDELKIQKKHTCEDGGVTEYKADD